MKKIILTIGGVGPTVKCNSNSNEETADNESTTEENPQDADNKNVN